MYQNCHILLLYVLNLKIYHLLYHSSKTFHLMYCNLWLHVTLIFPKNSRNFQWHWNQMMKKKPFSAFSSLHSASIMAMKVCSSFTSSNFRKNWIPLILRSNFYKSGIPISIDTDLEEEIMEVSGFLGFLVRFRFFSSI